MSDRDPLFLQLLAFTDCSEIRPLLLPLERLRLDVVLYKDLNDPQGIGLLTLAEDPDSLVGDLREMLEARIFRVLMQQHELTMTGYSAGTSTGGEPTARVVQDDAYPWVAWYPLRPRAAFAALDAEGRRAWFAGLAADAGLDEAGIDQVVLEADALNRHGNRLVHGVHARTLLDLSRFVAAARSGAAFAEHIAATGPFFVGRAMRSRDTFTGPEARW